VLELLLYTYTSPGQVKEHSWKFTPVQNEPGFEVFRNDTPRATGAGSSRPYWIKEIRDITIGAGMLRIPEHKENFLRLLVADKILLFREYKHKPFIIEFELRIDEEIRFEYLRDYKSLKRKDITLVEKDPNYYDSFEEFIEERLSL
jgi:hypothetical protein